MYHQYAPFYSELWNKLRSGETLTYSWDIGMGTNFISLMAYYLASPVNWIIMLFPQKYMIEIMNALIIVKLSFASVTLAYYLTKRFNTKKCTVAVFSIFYALSGYVCAYSWNIMWLDCIVLLPLIMLGLERLVKENKGFLYCISLGLCIFTNYYISIMVCISVAIYFVVLILSMDRLSSPVLYLKKILRWGFYSILAAGLAACFLLPEIYTFSLSASSSTTFPQSWTAYFSVVEMLTRQLMYVPVHLGLDHYPNIFCGVAVFILIPMYICDSKVKLTERVGKCAILLIFLLSYNLNVFNYIWHGFHFPNSLPARQAFIYIFFVLAMSYEAFHHLKSISDKAFGGAVGFALIFLVVASELFKDSETFTFKTFYVSGLFMLMYAALLFLERRTKCFFPYPFIIALMLVVIECSLNLNATGLGTTSRTAYLADYDSVSDCLEEVENEDSSFYRIDKVFGSRSKNDGAWHNYKTISTFSSTCNAGMSTFFTNLGLEASTNAYGYNGSTLVTNSLFSVKYLLSNTELRTDKLFSYVTGSDGEYVYKNNYTLPVGYAIDHILDESESPSSVYNGIENQNNLIASLTGVTDVFQRVFKYSSVTEAEFVPTMSGHMYIYKPENTTDYMSVGINGVYTTFSSLKTDNRILDAGYVTASDVVTIGCDPSSSFTVYILDEEKFLQAYNKLNSNAFVVDSYTTTSFTGTVTTSSDGTFLFSIPFDKGWSVYIDGKKCTTYAAFDALLATDLTAGTHTVKLKYTPVNYVLGCIISVLCIIILIVIHLARKFVYKEILEDSDLPAIVIDLLNNEDVVTQREPRKIAAMAELNEMDDFDNIVLEDEEYANEAESDDYSEDSKDTASGEQENIDTGK
jgi:uncharacterized membrane protein YfhO